MERQLYIWFNRTQLPVGYPAQDDTVFKSIFNSSRPKEMPHQPWKLFNPVKMSFPPENEYRFPLEMFLVITKNYPSIEFDYFHYSHQVKLVSQPFLHFLQEKGLTSDYYEQATVNIIDTKGNSVANKEYIALRFGKHNDEDFNFPVEGRKRAAGLQGYFLYPNLSLKESGSSQAIFSLSEFCYNDTLIFTEAIKDEIFTRFHKPEIYRIQDFPFVFNNKYNHELLPFDNEYKLQPSITR